MKRIAIHGVPRSGTSWLGSIFDSSPNVSYRHQPLFSYAFKSFLNHKSSKKEIIEFFKLIADTEDPFLLQKEQKEKGTIPIFDKNRIEHIAYKEARYHHIISNLLETDGEIIVVGIIRNPKAVLASWFNAPKEFEKQHWSFEKEWELAERKNKGKTEEFYGFRKWKEVAQLFLQLRVEFPERFYLVKYDSLLKNPKNETKAIFRFCGIPYSEQTSRYLEDSTSENKAHDPYSVYRKKTNDDSWKEVIPKSVDEAISRDLENSVLEQFINT